MQTVTSAVEGHVRPVLLPDSLRCNPAVGICVETSLGVLGHERLASSLYAQPVVLFEPALLDVLALFKGALADGVRPGDREAEASIGGPGRERVAAASQRTAHGLHLRETLGLSDFVAARQGQVVVTRVADPLHRQVVQADWQQELKQLPGLFVVSELTENRAVVSLLHFEHNVLVEPDLNDLLPLKQRFPLLVVVVLVIVDLFKVEVSEVGPGTRDGPRSVVSRAQLDAGRARAAGADGVV